ncbi:MAG: hypothetical protein AB7G06_01700 [Bdellovibrionales bacterium]
MPDFEHIHKAISSRDAQTLWQAGIDAYNSQDIPVAVILLGAAEFIYTKRDDPFNAGAVRA